MENNKNKLLLWVVLVIVILVVVLLIKKSNKPGLPLTYATLALQPTSHTAKVGETFSVDIILDTAGKPIDGVDVSSLHYDPKVLAVVDQNTAQAGVQIMPGTVLAIDTVNQVDETAGTIVFGQVSQGGASYSGVGTLATVHFKALEAGSAQVKFDFTPGNTADTNAAYQGMDQLKSASGGTYIVSP